MSARGWVLAAVLVSGTWVHAAPVPPGSATTGKAKRAIGAGVLNLNTATLDQLDALPGITPKLAASVVAERAARPFSQPEDVMRVPGMSKKRFERLRPHLAVTGPTSFVPASARPGAGARKASARQTPPPARP